MNKVIAPEIICKAILEKDDKFLLVNHENVMSFPTILVDSYPIILESVKDALRDEFSIIADDIDLVRVDKFNDKIVVFFKSSDWHFLFDDDSVADKIYKETSFTEGPNFDKLSLGNWLTLGEIKKLADGSSLDNYSSEYIKAF